MMPYEEERARKGKRMTAGAAIGITVCILAYGPAVFGHWGERHESKELKVNGDQTKAVEGRPAHPAEEADGGSREIKDISLKDAENGIREMLPGADLSRNSGTDERSWQETSGLLSCPAWAEPVKVVTVTDGDTLFVELKNGEKRHVRLLEVNTPESGKAEAAGYARATDYGEMAAAYTKKLIYEMAPSGEDVILYLSKDIGESPSDTDKYGRLLRIVWLEMPRADAYLDPDAIRISTMQGVLLSEGMAEAVYYDDSGYKTVFDEIESEARTSGKGLWVYGEEAFERQEF